MRHVVWDWNGTLLDDITIVVRAVNAALPELGGPRIELTDYQRHYARPVQRLYEGIVGRSISMEEWRRLDDRYHNAYKEALSEVKLAPDALSALQSVEDAGASQSLLSMWRHEWLAPLVRELGLSDFFVHIDGLHNGWGETKAAHLDEHIDMVKESISGSMSNEDILVIGDTLDDGAAAAHVGAPCVLYDGGSHAHEELAAAGLPVASSLLEALRLGGLVT